MAVRDARLVVSFMNGMPGPAGVASALRDGGVAMTNGRGSEMGPTFQPMSGAEGWQLSNPSIVSLGCCYAHRWTFSAKPAWIVCEPRVNR